MDIPYATSGASSRAHYALVRRVEQARSQIDVERYLEDEVQLMRRKFALSSVSTNEIRTSLILLLYCLTVSDGIITRLSLEFAIPSALHLAEAGANLSEKQTGYMFCDEIMASDHDMRLMLINTLRKDLESRNIPRMTLSLRSLIAVPFPEVVPAVLDLMLKATSHSSSRIRTFSMKAIRSLATADPSILIDDRVTKAVETQLLDADKPAAKAALEFCFDLSPASPALKERMLNHCIEELRQISRKEALSRHSLAYLYRLSQTLTIMLPKQSNVNEIFEIASKILASALRRNNDAIGIEAIKLITLVPPSLSVTFFRAHDISAKETSTPKKILHPMDSIRHLLSSQSLNDHYTFLSYLSLLPVQLWTGPPELDSEIGQSTAQEFLPPALDQWEVERIVSFMGSSDEQIRKLTLGVLMRVSRVIVEQSFESLLEYHGSAPDALKEDGASTKRLLEMADALCSACKDITTSGRTSADTYASICELYKGDTVSHEALEHAIRALRKGNSAETQQFVTSWVRKIMQGNNEDQEATIMHKTKEKSSPSGSSLLVNPIISSTPTLASAPRRLNWTLMLIFVSFVCEHAEVLPHGELKEVIRWLACCLEFYPPTMQEPMLLCIIRLVALLENASEVDRSVIETIATAGRKSASKLFRKYCDAFESSLQDLKSLKVLIGDNKTLSIPAVVSKLDRNTAGVPDHPTSNQKETKAVKPLKATSNSGSIPLTSVSLAQSQLKYAAYDLPEKTSSSRVKTTRTLSPSSLRSSSRASSTKARPGDTKMDLTKTITAGDLALAEGSADGLLLPISRKSVAASKEFTATQGLRKLDKQKGVDLISLDSPFLTEPMSRKASSSSDTSSYMSLLDMNDFNVIWTEGESSGNSTRGWLDAPLDNAVLRLQGLGLHIDVMPIDDAPFQGDLKVIIKSDPSEGKNNTPNVVAIRLRDGEEGSCLWQMRSSDHALLLLVKQALSG